MSGTVLVLQEPSPVLGRRLTCNHCTRDAQVSYDMRRHLFRGAESTMPEIEQVCSDKMHEEYFRQPRAGDQPSGNSSFAEAFSSCKCDQAFGGPLVRHPSRILSLICCREPVADESSLFDSDQPTGRLALVFELMDMNIYELIRGRRNYVPEDRVKSFIYQLLKAMDHMHRNGIFHRDIKPENILIMDDSLKLADFGSCRGVYSKQPYTEYISTRWYRAPECLLTDGYYNYKMDMWGVGCVFFEIISLFPLFPGTNELDQIQKIHKVMGTPPQQLLDKMRRRSQHADFKFPQQDGSGIARLIPHASPACVELLNKLLAYNPDDRISARQALRHPYFKDLREKEKLQQAFLSANRSNSLRPSPRLGMHDLSAPKPKEEEKTQAVEKTNGIGNPSTTSTPRSMASTAQFPNISGNAKAKEDGKETGGSSPLSHFGDSRTPATLTSVGSAVSLHVGPTDTGSTCMDLDGGGGSTTHGLPPIKNSYTLSMLSPKPHISAAHPSSLQRHSQYHSPKAHSVKAVKIVKGTKSHRVLPELSPKSVSGGYKPGEPPPYKKRANTKYTSPYSQRYLNQLTATMV